MILTRNLIAPSGKIAKTITKELIRVEFLDKSLSYRAKTEKGNYYSVTIPYEDLKRLGAKIIPDQHNTIEIYESKIMAGGTGNYCDCGIFCYNHWKVCPLCQNKLKRMN